MLELRQITANNKCSKGAVLVETVIAVPLICLFIAGLVNIGSFLWEMEILLDAVRYGARSGMVFCMTYAPPRPGDLNTQTQAKITTSATAYITTFNPVAVRHSFNRWKIASGDLFTSAVGGGSLYIGKIEKWDHSEVYQDAYVHSQSLTPITVVRTLKAFVAAIDPGTAGNSFFRDNPKRVCNFCFPGITMPISPPVNIYAVLPEFSF